MALNIAERLLNYKIETDTNCILAVMARGLNALPAGKSVVLRVNPMDEKICRENVQKLQGMLKHDVALEVLGDESIPLGGCRVESEEAEVELLLQRELQLLGKKLLKLASSGEIYFRADENL